MRFKLGKILAWTPILIGFLLTVFFSLFAIEVLYLDYNFFEKMGVFFLHLIPALIILGSTIAGWRWPGVGAFLFMLFGFGYIPIFNGLPLATYIIISGPLFLNAILFLVSKLFLEPKGYVLSDN